MSVNPPTRECVPVVLTITGPNVAEARCELGDIGVLIPERDAEGDLTGAIAEAPAVLVVSPEEQTLIRDYQEHGRATVLAEAGRNSNHHRWRHLARQSHQRRMALPAVRGYLARQERLQGRRMAGLEQPSVVDSLNFTDVELREHQWIDSQGTLWRWKGPEGGDTGCGWQYWQEDPGRWRYHGLSLHLHGPYRIAQPHERCEDEGQHDVDCFCDDCAWRYE